MFDTSPINEVANTIRTYSYMLAGQIRSRCFPGCELMAMKQEAAGNVAAEVYLALNLRDGQRALNAMRMMNEYSQQQFRSEQARMGGAYSFSLMAVQDKMKADLDDLQNKATIAKMEKQPLNVVLNYLRNLFNQFNQFLGR